MVLEFEYTALVCVQLSVSFHGLRVRFHLLIHYIGPEAMSPKRER